MVADPSLLLYSRACNSPFLCLTLTTWLYQILWCTAVVSRVNRLFSEKRFDVESFAVCDLSKWPCAGVVFSHTDGSFRFGDKKDRNCTLRQLRLLIYPMGSVIHFFERRTRLPSFHNCFYLDLLRPKLQTPFNTVIL